MQPRNASIPLKPFEKKGAWSSVALSWQVAVLKILAASESGEVTVAAVARDLSILVSSPDGWERKLRRSIPSRPPREIFSDGLVDRPAKGIWRITQAGRDYLYLLESPLEFEEAAE
jgi:hypothetical protein